MNDQKGVFQTVALTACRSPGVCLIVDDELEILSEEHPTITLRLVTSTVSTCKQWIEI